MFELTLLGGLWIGLLSSFTHCAGMCGPMQFLLKRSGKWGALAFHFGRITGYSTIGIIASFFMSNLMTLVKGEMGWMLKILFVSLYFISFFILWFGMGTIEKKLGPIFPSAKIAQILSRGDGLRLLPAGAMMALLPCPTTLSALALSLSLGDTYMGGLSMLLFGLGTLPSLVLLQRIGSISWLRNSHLAARFVALYFLGSGIFQAFMMITNHRPCCH